MASHGEPAKVELANREWAREPAPCMPEPAIDMPPLPPDVPVCPKEEKPDKRPFFRQHLDGTALGDFLDALDASKEFTYGFTDRAAVLGVEVVTSGFKFLRDLNPFFMSADFWAGKDITHSRQTVDFFTSGYFLEAFPQELYRAMRKFDLAKTPKERGAALAELMALTASLYAPEYAAGKAGSGAGASKKTGKAVPNEGWAVSGAAGQAFKPPMRPTVSMGYTPEQFGQYVKANKEAAVQQYIKDYGHHLDLDEARRYCGAFAESKAGALKYTQATHVPAGELIGAVYEHVLKTPAGPGTQNRIVFGGGAGGSGKSSALFNNPLMEEFIGKAHARYDTTLAGSHGLDRIDHALSAGKNVDIFFVARDPYEAIVSTFSRAETSGRIVPLDALVGMHKSAHQNIRQAFVKYAGDSRVRIFIVDNTQMGRTRVADVSLLDKADFTKLRERALTTLEQEYRNGNISEEIYLGILGGADTKRP